MPRTGELAPKEVPECEVKQQRNRGLLRIFNRTEETFYHSWELDFRVGLNRLQDSSGFIHSSGKKPRKKWS